MAKCTKCGNEIVSYEYQGVKFDICKGCASVIISQDNFRKLAEIVDKGCEMVDLFSLSPVKTKEEARGCTVCGHKMIKIYYDGIVLDRCDKCKLLFFDNGELSKYFAKFSSKKIDIMNNATFIKTFCDENHNQVENNEQTKEENKKIQQIDKVVNSDSSKLRIMTKEVEKRVAFVDGWLMVGIMLLMIIFGIALFFGGMLLLPVAIITSPIAVIMAMIILFAASGFKILEPQEAMVFTLFGKYYGTLRTPGFYWVNPFASATRGKISLKARTLDNGKQKINDVQGNPIEVGIIVTWEVRDTAKALFNVNDYNSFLSAQCDSALRSIVRLYPYDTPDESGKQSLKGDSEEISEKLKVEIQDKVVAAGINILDARISHLAYSSEIAMAMLQRQQANAVLDAKRTIVEGAVGMVEMAIDKLSQNQNINLDEKTKASMVNNLLVVLCSNKDSQPVVRNDII